MVTHNLIPLHPQESFAPVPPILHGIPPPIPPPVVTTSVGHYFDSYGGPALPLAVFFLAALAFDIMLRKYPPDYLHRGDHHHHPPLPPFIPPEFLSTRHRRRRRRRRKRPSTTAATPPAPPATLDPNLAHFQVNTPLGSLHVSSNAHKDKHKLLNKLLSKRQGLIVGDDEKGNGSVGSPPKKIMRERPTLKRKTIKTTTTSSPNSSEEEEDEDRMID